MPGANEAEMARLVAGIESFVTAGIVAFAQEMVELNNEGGDGAPPAPIDRGELRGSPRITVNAPSEEDSPEDGPWPLLRHVDVARMVQVQGFSPLRGDALYVTWIADHASIIEGGRRLGSHGRMLGSEQAPRGWIGLGIQVAAVRMEGWRYRRGSEALP